MIAKAIVSVAFCIISYIGSLYFDVKSKNDFKAWVLAIPISVVLLIIAIDYVRYVLYTEEK